LIAEVQDATGGRVEVASFAFDWTHLRADVTNFVIHGTEAPSEAPLFRTRWVQVELRVLGLFKKEKIELASLIVDEPQANVIVYPDGRTNIPEPKIKHKSNKTGLETVVDLAIRRFQIRNGSL